MYSADDERLCSKTICPKNCKCVNQVVLCANSTEQFIMNYISNNVKAIVMTSLSVTIEQNMFVGISKLLFLNMSGCYFQRLSFLSKMFHGLSNLKMLDLSFTNIHHLPNFVFQPLVSVNRMSFFGCKIFQLYPYIFPKAVNLQNINMSKLFIKKIHSNTFCQLFYLAVLDISYNLITEIHNGTFYCLDNLNILDMSHNQIVEIDNNILNQLSIIQFIYVDTISQCCHLPLTGECIYPNMNHETYICQTILSNSTVLRYTYFFIGILIIICNVLSVVCRRLSKHHQKNFILCMNLSLADMLVGLYFLIVSVTDIYFGNRFIKINDTPLIASTCHYVSILPVMTTLMSNSICFLMSVQKLLVTKYYFAEKYLNVDSDVNHQLLLILIWISWLFVTIVYVAISTPDSLLCFVPYTVNRTNLVNMMTVLLFMVYGGVIFIASCVIYCAIVNYVMTVVKVRTDISQQNSTSRKVVKHVVLVLVPNFLSWISISMVIVMALLSNNNHISMYVAKLLLCCSLPLNAITNSFIHSFLPLLKSR